MISRKALVLTALTAAGLAATTACAPRAGQKCDPKKELSYYSTHTENGKTTTVSLECKRVGIDRYEWRKV